MKGRAWLGTALVLAGLGAGAARGAEGNGPAELPPPGFTGSQYVDSRGCVYMRAGLDGQVAWVPRLAPDRSALCGFAPSIAAPAGPEVVPAAAGGPDLKAAPARRPTVQRAAPMPDAPSPVAIRIPPGYRAVWADDRLNPARGPRTAEGDAQMALIWTDSVPRRPVQAPARATAPRYLRVGVFDAPEAARPTVRRIRSLGLPASRAEGRRGARPVEVIYAGPFADADAAAQAQARLERAGFRNLVPRR